MIIGRSQSKPRSRRRLPRVQGENSYTGIGFLIGM